MLAAFERFTGLALHEQRPLRIVASGHAATHWCAGTMYLVLPFVTDDLGLSIAQAGLITSTFLGCSFAANFASGMVVDVLGRRILVQVVALVVGALAMMGFGTTDGVAMLLVFAGIMGAMNNLWHPAAISFLSATYRKNRGYALSIHTLGASVGDSAAPLVIGLILSFLTWQETVIWGTIPVLIVALWIMIALNSLDKGEKSDPSKRITVLDYFTGLRDMFSNKAAMGLCFMAGFRSMAQNGLMMFIPFYLVQELEVGAIAAGMGLFALNLGGFVAGPLAGVWSDRIGRRPVVLAAATGTTVVVSFLAVAQNEILFIAGVSVLGFVLFAMRPVIHSWMMDLTPENMHGSATSALFGVQAGLSFLIPILGGWMADSYGLGSVFYLLAGVMLVANLLVLMLPKGERDR